MARPLIVLGYNGLLAPAPMPVRLPNGFVYEPERRQGHGPTEIISDADGNTIVMADVIGIMWHEHTVYGLRLGLSNEPYYFVCTYGEDCTDTQHLRETEFIRIVREKELPEYTARKARTYRQLLREQSKAGNDTGG